MPSLQTKSYCVAWDTGQQHEEPLDRCAIRGMYFQDDARTEALELRRLGRPATVVEISSMTVLIKEHMPAGQFRWKEKK